MAMPMLHDAPADGLPATASAALRTFWRHPSPIMLSLLVVGLLVTRLLLASWTWWDLVAVAAVVVAWPLYEWLVHVTVLHFRPKMVGRRMLDLKVARIHREHHTHPWRLPLVFIPLHIFPLTAVVLFVGAYLLWPASIATTILLTYFTFSLHYEFCHYVAHINWCPPNAYYRRRVRMHRWHHFQNERMWWGVSTSWADKLLGTQPDPQDAPRSSTTHDILAWEPKARRPGRAGDGGRPGARQ